MPDLPEYQPNQQVKPGPLIDSAPIYQGYSKLADQIEETTRPFAQQLADKQAQNEGTVAGADPNFHTVPSIGQAAQVYNEAGLAANRQEVNTNMIKGLTALKTQLTTDANGNPIPVTQDTINQFHAKNSAYLQGLLSTVPQENRQFVKNKWASMTTDIQSGFQQQLFKQYDNEAKMNAYDAYNTSSGRMSDLANKGFKQQAMSEYGTAVQNIDSNVKYGRMDPTTGANLKQELRQNLVLNLTKGDITKELQKQNVPYNLQTMHEVPENVHKIIGQFQDQYEGLYKSPLALQRAVNNLKQQAKDGLIDNHISQADRNRQLQAVKDRALHTGTIDVAQYNSNLASFNDPNDAQAYATGVQSSLYMGQQLNALKYASQTQAGIINGNIQNYNKTLDWGDDAVGARIMQQVGFKGMKAADQIMKDRQNGYSVVEGNPAYQAKLKEINANSNIKDIPLARSQAAIDLQKSLGFHDDKLQIMDNKLANAMHTQFKAMNPTQQYEYITQTLPKEFGNSPQMVSLALRQMWTASHDTTPNPYLFANVVRNPDTYQNASDVAQAFEHNTSEWLSKLQASNTDFGTSKKDLDGQVRDEGASLFSAYQSQNPNINLQPYVDAVSNYAAYRMSRYSEDKNTAVKNAFGTLLGNQTNIDSYNGKSYVLPKKDMSGQDIDVESAQALIGAKMRSIAADKDLAIPKDVEPDIIDPEKRMKLYRSNVTGAGYVINVNGSTFEFRDKDGNLLRNSKGEPYKLQYSEITNPNKDQQQEINGFKQSDNVTSGLTQAVMGG